MFSGASVRFEVYTLDVILRIFFSFLRLVIIADIFLLEVAIKISGN